jgi:hypothetical protein
MHILKSILALKQVCFFKHMYIQKCTHTLKEISKCKYMLRVFQMCILIKKTSIRI